MPRFDLLRKGFIKKVKDLFQNVGIDQTQRGAEIIEEEFDRFFNEMRSNSLGTETFADLDAVVSTVKRGRDVLYLVTIDHPVYRMLDEGVDKVPRHASSYGLKAFPILLPRSSGHEPGNRTMSQPNSIKLRSAESNVGLNKDGQPVIFRPVIRNPIEPRNFTEQIMDIAARRIRDEKLQISFEIRKA